MNTYKRGISIFLPVYNEESRILFTLKSIEWCDEVIVIDKGSIDKTVEIASQFKNVTVIIKKEDNTYTSSEYNVYLDKCSYNYSMTVTASDIIHPDLAFKIKKLVDSLDFNYDAIEVPYKGYFLGIYEKFSPWYLESTIKVVKTCLINIQEGEVHAAIKSNIQTVYKITPSKEDEAYYHLTHESADGVLNRHIRYWRAEASSPEPLNVPLKIVIKKTLSFLFYRRTFFKGKAAIALAFSYLTYYMITYIYRWNHMCNNATEVYRKIRDENLILWEKAKNKKITE